LFRAIVLPALKKFLNAAADVLGEHIPCIIGGNAAPILDALMETEPGYVICPSETDQAEFMRKMEAWPDVMVRINMNPGLITGGAEDALQAEMDRVLALAASREKVCIGTGVLPYEADPETVDAIARYIAQRAAE
jgi:hypothetical protein